MSARGRFAGLALLAELAALATEPVQHLVAAQRSRVPPSAGSGSRPSARTESWWRLAVDALDAASSSSTRRAWRARTARRACGRRTDEPYLRGLEQRSSRSSPSCSRTSREPARRRPRRRTRSLGRELRAVGDRGAPTRPSARRRPSSGRPWCARAATTRRRRGRAARACARRARPTAARRRRARRVASRAPGRARHQWSRRPPRRRARGPDQPRQRLLATRARDVAAGERPRAEREGAGR